MIAKMTHMARTPARRPALLLLAFAASSAVALAQKPVITANGVQDAASYTPNVAQGSVFVVKGTNLCSAGLTQATLPLPTVLNNVKITFTAAGGATTDAYMVYTYNQGGVTQLAGVLPSTVAPGTYSVTVNNTGQVSDAVRAVVVARKYSIITASGSGSGRAVIQNYISQSQLDLNRFTTGTLSGFTFSPAKPGQTLILWGTGLGPITKPDNELPGAIDLRSQVDVKVVIGSSEITPVYAGRAPQSPGADQINFVLPGDVQTGCSVPLQVSVGGQLSNSTTVAIAPANASACSHPQFSNATLTKLDQGQTMVNGTFTLSSFALSATVQGQSFDIKTETAGGQFARFTADQLADASGYVNIIDTCAVYRRTGNQNALLYGTPAAALDAGASLTLTSTAGLNKQVTRGTGNVYNATLSSGLPSIPTIPGVPNIPGLPGSGGSSASIVAGTFQLKGTGGADIGAFTASVNVGNPLTVGAVSENIPRSRPLTVSWTGGNSNDLVAITGVSGSVVGGTSQDPIYDAGVFVCTTTAGRGSFTVSPAVLGQLPATPPGGITSGNGIGILLVAGVTQPAANNGFFTAPLTAGGNIDSGLFIATVGTLKTVNYQ